LTVHWRKDLNGSLPIVYPTAAMIDLYSHLSWPACSGRHRSGRIQASHGRSPRQGGECIVLAGRGDRVTFEPASPQNI